MSTKYPTPWRFEPVQQWPFGFRVLAANGECIFSQDAAYSTTTQRNLAENLAGKGFGSCLRAEPTPAEVAAHLAEQNSIGYRIAAAPKLEEALSNLLDALSNIEIRNGDVLDATQVAEEALKAARGEQ